MEIAAYMALAIALVLGTLFGFYTVVWKRGGRRKLLRYQKRRTQEILVGTPKGTPEDALHYMGKDP